MCYEYSGWFEKVRAKQLRKSQQDIDALNKQVKPAPAAKTASRVVSSASSGTNQTSLCRCSVTFARAVPGKRNERADSRSPAAPDARRTLRRGR